METKLAKSNELLNTQKEPTKLNQKSLEIDDFRERLKAKAQKIEGLDNDEIEYYTEAFLYFDLDKDERISSRELKIAMESVGLKPSDEELRQMIMQIDEDGDMLISPEEFFKLIFLVRARSNLLESEQDIREAFSRIEDGTGLISAKELCQFYSSVGDWISVEQAQDMIKMIDSDADGKADYKDFYNLIKG